MTDYLRSGGVWIAPARRAAIREPTMLRFFKALLRFFESRTLAVIAEDAVALVLALYPNAKWAELLDAVVKILVTSSKLKDRAVLERAAAGALSRAGKRPGA